MTFIARKLMFIRRFTNKSNRSRLMFAEIIILCVEKCVKLTAKRKSITRHVNRCTLDDFIYCQEKETM